VLALIRQPLNREELAWATSRENPTLLSQVNSALASWDADGTRAAILDRWVPYWRELERQTAQMR
jgi:ABC-type amino acid transport substrate-binding protein